MSTIVLVSQVTPDRKLEKETIYKYHPSGEIAAKIVDEFLENTKIELDDSIFIDLDFKISVKQYDFAYKPTDKNKCYQEFLNTKTEEQK